MRGENESVGVRGWLKMVYSGVSECECECECERGVSVGVSVGVSMSVRMSVSVVWV